MPKYKNITKMKDDEKTTIGVHGWFLKFLDGFRNGRESWEIIAMRLMTKKRLNPEESVKMKKEVANYEKHL